MAMQLDLEEQEQIDELKHFWSRWGDLIVWCLIAVLAVYAAWNGWQYWQRREATQSAVLFETVERSIESADLAMVKRSFGDMKDKFGTTTYASQAAFDVARAYYLGGQPAEAEDTLNWIIKNAPDAGYTSLARLRLAALLVERKALPEAQAVLAEKVAAEFEPLVEDRLGDIEMLGKHSDAAAAHYQKAWQTIDARAPYRKYILAKLNAMGIDPSTSGTNAQALATKAKD